MATTPGQSAILSGSGYSPWQAPLAALFSGISAAGQPGGWSNFGAGVTQGQQNFQRGQAEQQMMDLRRMQMAQAEEEQRRANQEREQEETALKGIQDFLSGGSVQTASAVQPVGNYGAATGGAMQSQPGGNIAAMFGGDEQRSALFSQYAKAYPREAFQMLVERGFAEPDAPKTVGGMQWNPATGGFEPIPGYTEQAKAIAEAGRNPVSSDGVWEKYVDPQTGRTGQINRKTNKVDWDPGNTMMTQVGTDTDGNPIYDFVSDAPGPSKEFESKLANQSMLLSQGLGELETLLDAGKVSAGRVATAEAFAEKGGTIGETIAQATFLTPEDKQYMAARAAALESLATTVTGAAFTEQQKTNFQNMLPRPTDDDATIRSKLRKMRAYLKELETNAKVSNRRAGGQKNPADMTDDELMNELNQ